MRYIYAMLAVLALITAANTAYAGDCCAKQESCCAAKEACCS